MATITTLGANDSGSTSRNTINTNFTNLNNQVKIIYKSADETVNNSSTLQDDDSLTFAVGANEAWGFQSCIRMVSSVTPDIKFKWSFPSGTTISWEDDDAFNTELVETDVKIYAITSGSNKVVGFYGVILTGSTAGNITLQWAQNTADPSDTKVLKGSHIIAYKLA